MRKLISFVSALAIAGTMMGAFAVTASAQVVNDTVDMTTLSATDYNADNYTAVPSHTWMSIKVSDTDKYAVQSDGYMVKKSNVGGYIKIDPTVGATLTVTFTGGEIGLYTGDTTGTPVKYSATFSVAVYEGSTYYIGGASSTNSTITSISLKCYDPQQVYNMTTLTASNYNSSDYTTVSGIVSLKSSSSNVTENGVELKKTDGAFIRIKPTVNGTVIVDYTSTSTEVLFMDHEDVSGNDKIDFDFTTGAENTVNANGEYYVRNTSSSSVKVTRIIFIPDEYADFATSDSINVGTATGDETENATTATAFKTAVTNNGTIAGTLEKLTWTVISDGQTGKKVVTPETTITVGAGGAVTFGLIVTDLNDENATVTVTAE